MGDVKHSGEYELSCGHNIDKPLDVEKRVKCPTCAKDGIVVRVIR